MQRISTLRRHLSSSSSASFAPVSTSSSSSSLMTTYKSPITSHVLDTSRGCPAVNMAVELQTLDSGSAQWHVVSRGVTNSDGRVATSLVPEGTQFRPSTYRIVFHTQQYFEANGITEYFYPEVTIQFVVKHVDQHYHVPLLINPFGYSTYRGS